MEQNVILITGANRGLGLETARQLAALGHIIFLGVRSKEKGMAAIHKIESPHPLIPVIIDLENEGTFSNAVDCITTTYGRLDVLINNAGVMLEEDIMKDSTDNVTSEILKRSFETNFFGTVALTNLLLPLLMKSKAPRIVNVSTNMGSLSMRSNGEPLLKTFAYNTTKTALNSYTVHLANAYAGTFLKVNSAFPGWVKTDMGTEWAPMEVSEGAETLVWLATLPQNGPNGGFFHKKQPISW